MTLFCVQISLRTEEEAAVKAAPTFTKPLKSVEAPEGQERKTLKLF